MSSYEDDQLSVYDGTAVSEVDQFVRDRINDPIRIEGITVWSFNNHTVNDEKLRFFAESAKEGTKWYIPYNVADVWAYIKPRLPEEIRNGNCLVYSRSKHGYRKFPNFDRDAEVPVGTPLGDSEGE